MLMTIVLIGAVPSIIFGFIIWRFQFVNLIAGYDEKKCNDKKGMSRWVGLGLVIASISSIAIAYALENYTEIDNGIKIIIFVFIFLVMLSGIALGTKKFEESK